MEPALAIRLQASERVSGRAETETDRVDDPRAVLRLPLPCREFPAAAVIDFGHPECR